MQVYNKKIASDERVELIHINLDKTDSKALAWAKKEHFPWPIVKSSVTKKKRQEWSFLKEVKVVPTYHLVNSDGAIILSGKSAIYKHLGY